MSRYFADEKVNTGRQLELDVLKALCVVGMIFIHILLDLGDEVAPTALDDYGTELFGAATFMICMGIGMCYSRNQTPAAYVQRGLALLTMGQFLNIMRDSIPSLIAWEITGEQFFIAHVLLVLQSDILSFAGLAFLLMALLKKFKLDEKAILCISVAMNFVGLLAWHYMPLPKNYLAQQGLAYFFITDAEAYFPLFCYFIFVAFGYFLGTYYPRIKDKDGLSVRVMLIGFPVTVIYYALRLTHEWAWLPELGSDLQYNMKPTPDAVVNCIFTVAFIGLLYKIVHAAGDRIPHIVSHFSENINSYYCIHYMFVMPVQTILIATTGGLISSPAVTLLYACFVTAACYFIIEMNEKHWHIHFVSLKGTKRIIFVAAVWAATIALVAYSYPRIEEFANIWNDYLLP